MLCLAPLGGCAESTQKSAATARTEAPSGPAKTPPYVAPAGVPQATSAQVPVDADDGVWGAPNAPVTIVVFTDLECPFCSEAHAILAALEQEVGPERLRVVVKHIPLAQHAGAVPAARVAQAIRTRHGAAKFFEFLDFAFAHQAQIAQGKALELAEQLGLSRAELEPVATSNAIGAEVLRDVALADRLSVAATPHLRVNGLGLTGVVSLPALRRLVATELEAAQRLRSASVPADGLYQRRVAENFAR
ncbi:MAG TPA: thioredoxin domain-containing protein [Polyangiaceae bacterium]|nr:thioredoxin domain-containing protein [Polyangiaceae bacterium]